MGKGFRMTRSKVIHLMGALALLMSMFSHLVSPVGAQEATPVIDDPVVESDQQTVGATAAWPGWNGHEPDATGAWLMPGWNDSNTEPTQSTATFPQYLLTEKTLCEEVTTSGGGVWVQLDYYYFWDGVAGREWLHELYNTLTSTGVLDYDNMFTGVADDAPLLGYNPNGGNFENWEQDWQPRWAYVFVTWENATEYIQFDGCEVETCETNPEMEGCEVETCETNPEMEGCEVETCETNPEMEGCEVETCETNPEMEGCEVETCETNPEMEGCEVETCETNPEMEGCEVETCETNPEMEGCEVETCETNPEMEGCEVETCETNPEMEGCEVETCETNPEMEGCEVETCETNPEMEGCEVETCETNPEMEGCEVETCETNPNMEGCKTPTPSVPVVSDLPKTGSGVSSDSTMLMGAMVATIALAATAVGVRVRKHS